MIEFSPPRLLFWQDWGILFFLVKWFPLAILFLPLVQAAEPDDYYRKAEKLSGKALRSALHRLIDDHRVLKYSETRAPIAHLHEDPRKPDHLIQIYTQKSVPKNRNDLWNREHLWPRSRGNSDKRGPDDSDLHHLFPSNYKVNADRGSLLFDITQPAKDERRWSMDEDSFQPPREVVGDIARALFYMDVRYDGSDRRTTDLKLVDRDFNGAEMGSLAVLLQWHLADPPDDFERRRNDLIFSEYQGNRNPFVDRPEFAIALWGPPEPNPAEAVGFSPAVGNAIYGTLCNDSIFYPSHSSSYLSPLAPHPPLSWSPPRPAKSRLSMLSPPRSLAPPAAPNKSKDKNTA